MEKDRLIELFELVLHNLTNAKWTTQSGICKEIVFVYEHELCSENEKKELFSYLTKNKPTADNQYAVFFNNSYWFNSPYWWLPIYHDLYDYSLHTKDIRIAYLTKLIENIK